MDIKTNWKSVIQIGNLKYVLEKMTFNHWVGNEKGRFGRTLAMVAMVDGEIANSTRKLLFCWFHIITRHFFTPHLLCLK